MQENPLKRIIYTVSEFSEGLARSISEKFPSICVRGEVTNLSKPRSGHWYFALKDEDSQLRAVMFRSSNIRAPQIKDGDEIIACGKPGIYRERGDLQLLVSHIESAGEGALQKQFELLKKELLGQGFFDTEKKKTIPEFPYKLAVISSPSGAVVHDIRTVTARRASCMPLVLLPAEVQGSESINSLCNAIRLADKDMSIDLIILARGGGSLEDFIAFNSREIAEAIFECSTPVISSVGHESDVSIADLVADIRAATPSEAAEIATAGYFSLPDKINQLQHQLHRLAEQSLGLKSSHLALKASKLKNPADAVRNGMQKLDNLESLLSALCTKNIGMGQQRLIRLGSQFNTELLKNQIEAKRTLNQQLTQRLVSAENKNRMAKTTQFESCVRVLESVSPLTVLGRGYSISKKKDGQLISSINDTQVHNQILTQIKDGQILSTVDEVIPESEQHS